MHIISLSPALISVLPQSCLDSASERIRRTATKGIKAGSDLHPFPFLLACVSLDSYKGRTEACQGKELKWLHGRPSLFILLEFGYQCTCCFEIWMANSSRSEKMNT